MTTPTTSDPGRIIAHRGASRMAPENTLAAFREAHSQGVSWIEFDVSLIGDGTPIIHHDGTLDRCTNQSGPITSITAGDLPGITAGGWFSPRYSDEPLPRLDAALDLIGELDLYANLEIKTHDEAPERIAGVVETHLAQYSWSRDRIVVSSFEIPTLEAFRRLSPEQPVAVLWSDPPTGWQEVTRRLSASALHIDYRSITSELLLEAKREGLDLRVYTINQPDLMVPFRQAGLTSVITDHPPLFLEQPEWKAWSES
ncbi:hypothetical protein KHP62_10995 [Rhodobacteraceae bacterium NNCM2]|nr:hypothetical protein [Coraliihabitans acroporae]